ncbi:MAG TPA: hypothetical protein VNJ01_00115 [Bacteriovoracaceae bacterium]|nr:hypothetical protein [Bacteriovoracaceae bacterium]
MKTLILFLALLLSCAVSAKAAEELLKIATFDSGFGGYFTAKEIEKEGFALAKEYPVTFNLAHYGDTQNAPYGEKTPEMIAQFAAKGISRAFADGAQEVYIACNTASTQFQAIKILLENQKPGLGARIISIIDSSVSELRAKIDQLPREQKMVRVGILATPATVRTGVYPKALAASYAVELSRISSRTHTQKRWFTQKGSSVESIATVDSMPLPGGKKLEIYQMGPGNWVEMIEHGAPGGVQNDAVQTDLKLLAPEVTFDVVGEFCTHFPVFDGLIKTAARTQNKASPRTSYIRQGPLMAGIFKDRITQRFYGRRRNLPLTPQQENKLREALRPVIYISGSNIKETKSLSTAVFPDDPQPLVVKKDF